jgi:hypothetical protein
VRDALLAVLTLAARLPPEGQPAQWLKLCPQSAWGERSAPSWAGILKQVEHHLRRSNADYRLLHVTAMDGHRTWQLPLQMTVHLLAEKLISTHRGLALGLASRRAAPSISKQSRMNRTR